MKTQNYTGNHTGNPICSPAGNLTDHDIGWRIRKVREMMNCTQESVAIGLGISVTAYGDIERGKSGVTPGRVEHIARILKVHPDLILKFDQEKLMDLLSVDPKEVTGWLKDTANHYGRVLAETLSQHQELINEQQKMIDELRRLIHQLRKQIKMILEKFHVGIAFLLQFIPANMEVSLMELMG